jgi:hypothetical protein
VLLRTVGSNKADAASHDLANYRFRLLIKNYLEKSACDFEAW